MKEKYAEDQWDQTIGAKGHWLSGDFAGLWKYRELIWLFIKRDFVTFYKQTVLGPVWYILQPLFTTGVFTIVFGKLAGISTDGIPPFLFYMSGTVCWNYFSQSLTKTSNTFLSNAGVFGKVYFPRLTVPIAGVLINVTQFILHFAMFSGFYLYFYFTGVDLSVGPALLLLPLLVLQLAMLSMGVGILVSSLTTKYRDLVFALTFGVQLWMYASPIVYPASLVPAQYLDLYMLNPVSSIVEIFRYIFFGQTVITIQHVVLGWIVTFVLLILGLVMFGRLEKTFMDTV